MKIPKLPPTRFKKKSSEAIETPIKKSIKKIKTKAITIHSGGITAEQMMMIKYLVAGMPIEVIAGKLNVKVIRCKRWLKKENVIKALDMEVTRRIDVDAKKRRKMHEYIHSEIYDGILEKIANGSLKKMNTKSLFKFFMEFGKEIRTDAGENVKTKNITHKLDISDEIASRYKNLSATVPSIVDITMPAMKQIEEKRADEVVIEPDIQNSTKI